jgi:hypothetical protein
MYQVYAVRDNGRDPISFTLRKDCATRREATALSDSIRREKDDGASKRKSAIYDGNRLVQPVF